MPSKAEIEQKWSRADAISDQIVEVCSKALKLKPMPEPTQILVGQLLGLKAFLRTAPPAYLRPRSLITLEDGIDMVLSELINET